MVLQHWDKIKVMFKKNREVHKFDGTETEFRERWGLDKLKYLQKRYEEEEVNRGIRELFK